MDALRAKELEKEREGGRGRGVSECVSVCVCARARCACMYVRNIELSSCLVQTKNTPKTTKTK